jgi:imidazole glycerol-phosphate synthase subunit HisF
MLKVRIIPTLLFKNDLLVKGTGFDSWRHVGGAMQSIKVYNMREVDELIFVDITASLHDRPPDFATIDDLADDCFMPFTVGGGIRSVDDVRRLLQVGADKVSINTAAVYQPNLVAAVSARFGSQCVVVSIDVRKTASGYEVFTHAGTKASGLDPVSVARNAEAAGAGEILLTSIERDGTMTGYDVELIRMIADAVSIPVIASGGAGNYDHLVAAIADGKASAVAAAAMFHFTQHTPLEAKKHLAAAGIPVRL